LLEKKNLIRMKKGKYKTNAIHAAKINSV